MKPFLRGFLLLGSILITFCYASTLFLSSFLLLKPCRCYRLLQFSKFIQTPGTPRRSLFHPLLVRFPVHGCFFVSSSFPRYVCPFFPPFLPGGHLTLDLGKFPPSIGNSHYSPLSFPSTSQSLTPTFQLLHNPPPSILSETS